MTTRNFRLNNPGNIDRTNIKWQGIAADQPDPRFINFISPAWGFRAMARIIKGHFEQFNTVTLIVSRWAPPEENDTAAYIADVAKLMNVDARRILLWDIDALGLLRSIAIHEGGFIRDASGVRHCLWPDSDILEGIKLEATT